MRVLDTKLLRDLLRLWAQILAIAFVIAGGVASLILAIGSARSVEETRSVYYDRYLFADIFATAKRAPKSLLDRVVEIPGIAMVDARISRLVLLDIPNFREPASGQFISLPESGQPILNRLYLRSGRFPDSSRIDEVLVSDNFAQAHHFLLGSRFSALLNGRKRELVIVGTALSPEFVYANGPGDIIPDERRFGIVWMSERALASAYDLEGAFTSVSVKLLKGASEQEVIDRLDALLERYGGQAAHGRKDQVSHAWLNHELDMLHNMSRTLPPVFFLVAMFLVNLTLGRLVTLEREQIGLLKALGYRNGTIAWHYLKFALVIVVLGYGIGMAAGWWLGAYITRLFSDYYRFPFQIFTLDSDLYALAGLLSLGTAALGAIRALRSVASLAPAVAMQPPAPERFRMLLPAWLTTENILSRPTLMILRYLAAHPFRALFTMLGMAFATALLVVTLFTGDTMEQVIDVTYFMADRQDASVSFIEKRSSSVSLEMARLPGVLAVEPYRDVPIRIRHENVERRLMLRGQAYGAILSRIIDVNLRPVDLPKTGLTISDMLGKILNVAVGDSVEIDLLEGSRRTVSLPVIARIEDYIGMRATMDADALARLMREAPSVTSVNLSLDANELDRLYNRIKNLPSVSGMALQWVSLANFRKVAAISITTMAGIYTTLAAIIAFGIVYNSARIALSERARELASLRVLGFTRWEVFRILLIELTLLVVLGQPLGWLFGHGLAWVMQTNLAGEMMRVRMVIESSTYVYASLIVIAAALLSALVVRRRIDRLDPLTVLKSRD